MVEFLQSKSTFRITPLLKEGRNLTLLTNTAQFPRRRLNGSVGSRRQYTNAQRVRTKDAGKSQLRMHALPTGDQSKMHAQTFHQAKSYKYSKIQHSHGTAQTFQQRKQRLIKSNQKSNGELERNAKGFSSSATHK